MSCGASLPFTPLAHLRSMAEVCVLASLGRARVGLGSSLFTYLDVAKDVGTYRWGSFLMVSSSKWVVPRGQAPDSGVLKP